MTFFVVFDRILSNLQKLLYMFLTTYISFFYVTFLWVSLTTLVESDVKSMTALMDLTSNSWVRLTHTITCPFLGLFDWVITHKSRINMTTMVHLCFCFECSHIRQNNRKTSLLSYFTNLITFNSDFKIRWKCHFFFFGAVDSAEAQLRTLNSLLQPVLLFKKPLLCLGSDMEAKAVILGHMFTPREGLQICSWLLLTKQISHSTPLV